MAHSYRHSPFIGIAVGADSDKEGKVRANRALRVNVRSALSGCEDFDALVVPVMREVSNAATFPKDGKIRVKKTWKKYAEFMRK